MPKHSIIIHNKNVENMIHEGDYILNVYEGKTDTDGASIPLVPELNAQ
jgi:hypothetical protein